MFAIGVVNMSLLQNFIVFNVLFLLIVSACHTKRNKNYNKEREKTFNFKNASVPVYNLQSNEMAVNSNFPTIYFFVAWHTVIYSIGEFVKSLLLFLYSAVMFCDK